MQAYRLETAAETGDQWTGIIYHFEDWLRPHLDNGALEPVLESWWQSFSGPFPYYLASAALPPPLRAFVDFIQAHSQGVYRVARRVVRACK